MKEKLNKSHLSAVVKKSTTFDGEIDINDDLSFDGYFKGKFMQKKEQEISLKSIYNLMITKFESIDNKLDSIDTRLDSLENEIKIVKADVKNLNTKVIALDAKVTDLDNKVNKVIELNKDIINLNMLKVSKENKIWLFGNGDDNTQSK